MQEAQDQRLALPRPAPRGDQPAIRGRAVDRTSCIGNGSQGLADAEALYESETRGSPQAAGLSYPLKSTSIGYSHRDVTKVASRLIVNATRGCFRRKLHPNQSRGSRSYDQLDLHV